MKRILYLTLTIMLCLTFFTAVTWAEEKASAASDKILSQQQVDELLQADDNPAAYVKKMLTRSIPILKIKKQSVKNC